MKRGDLGSLPENPGIYIFRNRDGSPLYVGKAKSLKKRIVSYFSSSLESRLVRMVEEADRLEVVTTSTEEEAFLLEQTWIRNLKPKYNIKLTDDKSYPLLAINFNDPYPYIYITRNRSSTNSRKNVKYFGPFIGFWKARRALRVVQRLFGIRVCKFSISKKLDRPCIYYSMGMCSAPCVEWGIDKESYMKKVIEAKEFLQGKKKNVISTLYEKMDKAAKKLDFERAVYFRNLIRDIDAIQGEYKLYSLRGENLDIVGIYSDSRIAVVALFIMREGKVVEREEYFFENTFISEEQVVREFLINYYTSHVPPKVIVLPVEVEDLPFISSWIEKIFKTRVQFLIPRNGINFERIKSACENAKVAAFRKLGRFVNDTTLYAIQELLALSKEPRVIDVIDISHMQGKLTTGAVVSWKDGRLCKGRYRSFNLETGNNDYESLVEVIRRRYLKDRRDLPDLLVIDGGIGQLNKVIETLNDGGIDLDVVALAKREEVVITPFGSLKLDINSEVMHFLRMLRDEAHRFAKSRHSKRRKGTIKSQLECIPGIGPKRARRLLVRFGSLEEIRAASEQKLASVVGAKLASRIKAYINK